MRSTSFDLKNCSRLLAVTLLGLILASSVSAEELSSRKAKKLKRQADKQWQAGNADAALVDYRQLIDGLAEGNALRSSALFPVAVAEMAKGEHGLKQGAEWLDQYRATGDPQHRVAAQAIRAWIDQCHAIADQHAAQLDSLRAELSDEVERSEQEIADEKEDLGATVDKLKSQVQKLRTALANANNELEKKDEALEKLKKVVVGGG